jgi:hypothetical protein
VKAAKLEVHCGWSLFKQRINGARQRAVPAVNLAEIRL